MCLGWVWQRLLQKEHLECTASSAMPACPEPQDLPVSALGCSASFRSRRIHSVDDHPAYFLPICLFCCQPYLFLLKDSGAREWVKNSMTRTMLGETAVVLLCRLGWRGWGVEDWEALMWSAVLHPSPVLQLTQGARPPHHVASYLYLLGECPSEHPEHFCDVLRICLLSRFHNLKIYQYLKRRYNKFELQCRSEWGTIDAFRCLWVNTSKPETLFKGECSWGWDCRLSCGFWLTFLTRPYDTTTG